MTAVNSYAAALTCHPESRNETVQTIQARVHWRKEGVLTLNYTVRGNLGSLAIPPPRPPHRADHLWKHTCFELFVAPKDRREYYEFNFSPSGEWAMYAFAGYRKSEPFHEERAPEIVIRQDASSLELNAVVRLQSLPKLDRQSRLRLGLSAVIEENDGMLSYWGLNHASGKPDFHHPDRFALEIEPQR
jgi:hypothetical protein